MNRMRLLGAIVLASLIGPALGCGYHLTGKGSSLPAHIKVIAVPSFTNSTTRPELGQRVTEAVTEQLVRRGKYRIVSSEEGADAVLSGVVQSWTSRPVQLGQQRSEATRAAVTLRATVRFEDRTTKRAIYENDSYTFTSEYDVVGDIDRYFDTELGAVDEVAQDFARAVVSAVMQGF